MTQRFAEDTQNVTDADYTAERTDEQAPATFHSFDVVLSDLSMPDMNGIDLLRRIRGADNDVPVIILTGHESLESAISATRLHVSDYLTKSTFSMQELVAAIERALNEPPPG